MDYSRVKVGIYDEQQSYKNEEELLIFGYSCKLFRDDEKAVSVENGEHLIPWMGDSSLMIDRFDVRGTLYDLSEAESNSERPLEEVLSAVELKEEQLCEQERYFALYQDENQYQLAYEEEAKRLQVELGADGSYNQVGFNYSATPVAASHEAPEQSVPAQMAEPVTYNPSSDEEIFIPPQEMNIPYGLEVPRTVKQNKIILKTAKFIVSQGAQMEILIKTKQAGNPMFNFLAFDNPLNAYYKHVVSLIRNGRYRWEDETEGSSKSDSKDQYLHPNLSQSVRPDLTPGAVASPSRPSPHCAYTKLITKIREKQKASTIEEFEAPSPILPSSPLHPSVQVQDTRQIGAKNDGEPVVGLVDYPSFNQTHDGNSDGEEVEPAFTKKFQKSGASTHDYRNIKWPPPELQMVIDKMASYIIKNGSGFEEVVRNRGDPRFEFLNKTDEFHPYYKCKLQLYNEVYGDIFKNTSKSQEGKKKKSPEQMKNGGSRTISFSIKSREQEVPLTSHTTFPIESSTSEEDEELDEEEREKRRVERVQRRQARRQKEEKERKEREEFMKRERLKKEKEEEEKRKKCVDDESSSENEDLYDIFKYAQEMEDKDTATSSKPRGAESPEDSPEANSKQEERKKKAVAFLSKLKDEKAPAPIYGPQMPPNFSAGLAKSTVRTSDSSSASSVEEEKSPPPPPPPAEVAQPPPPPPPPKSPSLPPVMESSRASSGIVQFAPGCRISKEVSESPKRRKGLLEAATAMSSVRSGLNDPIGKQLADLGSDVVETHTRKSRSHKKHSRNKADSWSPSSSSRRGRKKRKRSRGSSHRRKKRRSRSRSRSRDYSKSHRSSHKKKQSKHSSHRDKSRKKKHKRHRSPSSVSSLPSSESSSPSTPSTLPSESESEMEVQVIECQEESDEGKRSSRGSSIVSLPSVRNHDADSNPVSKRLSVISEVGEVPLRREGSQSGEENSLSLRSSSKHSRHIFTPKENSNSSEALPDADKKHLFNPNTSSAMAKIAQGLRAKLNAMLEKDGKLD